MVAFPNCKINLGLRVLRKREDGFHDIATVFYPIPFKDALEIVPVEGQQPVLFTYGLPVQGNKEDNLCYKAWQLLKKDFPELPPVQIHLLKNIPMGAGLGGGSSDGAFMLQLLNNKFHLGLSPQQLIAYALRLGSDCPFFIINKPSYATGRGELMEEIPLQLAGYQLALVNPGIHVPTGWAFEQLQITAEQPAKDDLKNTLLQPVGEWKNLLQNDFEKPVFAQFPAIQATRENLYAMGAVYAAMSGSGSTVFGLFNKQIILPAAFASQHPVIQV